MKETKRIPTLKRMKTLVAGSVTEAVWPTRCAICERPGQLICAPCLQQLSYIDQNLCCPACGAPFGLTECTECNAVMLGQMEVAALPFATARNLVMFDEGARRVVTAFKDKGEQGLAGILGPLMANLVSPEQRFAVQAVTYIPASTAALKRRGFDHGQLLGQAVADSLGLPCLGLLARPIAGDQRELGRTDRVRNMAHAFCANPAAQGHMPQSVILVDDVMTTGASSIAAAQVLTAAGVQRIHVATFARAW